MSEEKSRTDQGARMNVTVGTWMSYGGRKSCLADDDCSQERSLAKSCDDLLQCEVIGGQCLELC